MDTILRILGWTLLILVVITVVGAPLACLVCGIRYVYYHNLPAAIGFGLAMAYSVLPAKNLLTKLIKEI